MSLCVRNICIKAGISNGIVVILFYQFNPHKVFKDIKSLLVNQNSSRLKVWV